MYSPALTTFTFYVDDLDKRKAIEAFLSGDISKGFSEANILNFSKSIHAFNYIFGGDSTLVPLASDRDFDMARRLLEDKKIHAFCAGRLDAKKKPR